MGSGSKSPCAKRSPTTVAGVAMGRAATELGDRGLLASAMPERAQRGCVPGSSSASSAARSACA